MYSRASVNRNVLVVACIILASSALMTSLSGCPGEGGNPAGLTSPGDIVLTDIEYGPEGLSPEEADAVAALSVDFPGDISTVEFLGGANLGLPAGTSTAKPRPTASGPGDCVSGAIGSVYLFHAQMILRAWELERIRNLPADTKLGLPAQPNGLAYVWGAENPTIRSDPEPYTCRREQDEWLKCSSPLYGLDCSGYVWQCVTTAGLGIPRLTSQEYNQASFWNQSGRIPDDWGVQMVRIAGRPRRWMTGDIATFQFPGGPSHIGMVVVSAGNAYILNSAGSPCRPCEYNSDANHGPTTWNADVAANDPKVGFTGVLRLIPTCAVAELADGQDSLEKLKAKAAALEAQINARGAELYLALLDCDKKKGDERTACLEQVYVRFLNEVCALSNEMICVMFRSFMLPVAEAADAEIQNFISMAQFLTNLPAPDGQKCPCRFDGTYGI